MKANLNWLILCKFIFILYFFRYFAYIVDFLVLIMLQYAYNKLRVHSKGRKGRTMELLAIKDGKGKGVYICNTEDEKNTILQQFMGCTSKIFSDSQKEAALSWANVTELKKIKKHDFVKLIDQYRKMGFAYVTVEMINGATFCIVPDDIYYLSTLYVLKYNDASEMFYLSQYGEELTYDVFMEYFDEFNEKNHNKMPDLKDRVRELLSRYDHPIMKTLEKTQISAFGDLIQLGTCCRDIHMEFGEKGSAGTRTYVQKDILEYITISMHNIVTVTPHRLDPKFEVADKNLVRALTELKEEEKNA